MQENLKEEVGFRAFCRAVSVVYENNKAIDPDELNVENCR